MPLFLLFPFKNIFELVCRLAKIKCLPSQVQKYIPVIHPNANWLTDKLIQIILNASILYFLSYGLYEIINFLNKYLSKLYHFNLDNLLVQHLKVENVRNRTNYIYLYNQTERALKSTIWSNHIQEHKISNWKRSKFINFERLELNNIKINKFQI